MKAQSSRRSLLGALAVLPAAAVPAVIHVRSASAAQPDLDAELIRLCGRLVELETERWLLCDYDKWAADKMPNKARYEALCDESRAVSDRIKLCNSPTTPAGIRAMAQAAIMFLDYDQEGNPPTRDFFSDASVVMLIEGASGGMVWPPKLEDYAGPRNWGPPASDDDPFVGDGDGPVAALMPGPLLDTMGTPEERAESVLTALAVVWRVTQMRMSEPGSVLTHDRIRTVLPIHPDWHGAGQAGVILVA